MPRIAALVLLSLALPASLTSPTPAAAATCANERGAAAKVLVERCLDVSPATHPPCNAQNACSLIEGEIRRGCGMLSGKDRPAYCDEY